MELKKKVVSGVCTVTIAAQAVVVNLNSPPVDAILPSPNYGYHDKDHTHQERSYGPAWEIAGTYTTANSSGEIQFRTTTTT